MGEEHSTVSSITSSSCHIFLNIILSFIVKPSFSLRLKFEIITYFQGSIIDLRSRKERKNKTAKLRAQRSGPQLKRRSKGAQTKNPATRFELPDFERSGLRSDAVVPLGCGRIRKLTPRECWRLQGFSDDMFDRAAAVNSDTQLYKQAGNGVTIPVVYAVGKRIVEIQNELNKEVL